MENENGKCQDYNFEVIFVNDTTADRHNPCITTGHLNDHLCTDRWFESYELDDIEQIVPLCDDIIQGNIKIFKGAYLTAHVYQLYPFNNTYYRFIFV